MYVSSGAGAGSRANAVCRKMGLQGRVVWFDAEANLWELSTRQGVADTVALCKAANINTIIVDIKPLSGLTLYNSRIAPRLTEYLGRAYPKDYDLLQTVIDEGHKAGIAVHASMDVFSEGSQKLGAGPAFDHPEWQCIEYGPDPKRPLRRVGDEDAVHHAVFVNPLHPEVRAYELSIVREICSNYPVDGIVFDRMRYPNIHSDFSDLTREGLERSIGRKIERWPEDVYVRGASPDAELTHGPLYKDWLTFRAQVMRDFLSEARDVAKSVSPGVKLGIYVGSWYPIYFDVGANWGSRKNRPDYEWWPDGYEETGYADLLDYIMTGCYYSHPTRSEALAEGLEEWRSVEAAAEESINAVRDETFTYGGLYLMQYEGRPDLFRRAVEQCLDRTQGCLIFDLVYLRNYDWWAILQDVFSSPTTAPHDVPGLRGQLPGA